MLYLSQQIEKGDTDRRFFSQKNIYDLTSNYVSVEKYRYLLNLFDNEQDRKDYYCDMEKAIYEPIVDVVKQHI